ncbi:MAG: Holliday junction branch migration protein RuvA [Gemmatimonadota bacterium]|nr:Holliday junction branch migration protein RuvA [Gemmatimonadota bacterium]MDH3426880.1 Holliday junction branch migration protein RuvA [Gemmatimonadota bacterium]
MISRVRGTLASVRADRVELTTASGVTYELLIPSAVLGDLGEPGSDVELHTALVAREDSLELFGFASGADRELFLRLQSASGVGPRLALAILGTMPASRIISAIRSRDHAALQLVSGIGRKTAERIALELADKLDDLGSGDRGTADPGPAPGALAALRALGYSAIESQDALARARRDLADETADTEELVRVALRHL